MLVWLDLETTGLDPLEEDVLEVAVIVTDDALNERACFQRVIYSPIADRVLSRVPEFDEKLRALAAGYNNIDLGLIVECYRFHDTGKQDVDPFVVKMHTDNGLWQEVRRGQALATVDADLARFIEEHAHQHVEVKDTRGPIPKITSRLDKPQLAGSSISFDRGFLAAHFPKTLDTLHYRNLDVSTLNEVARRFWPSTYEGRPRAANDAHRGMKDIEVSLASLRYYLSVLAVVESTSEAA